MSEKYLVVATREELLLPFTNYLSERNIIITGVGGTNVIKSLMDLPKDADILNIGKCGSPWYPVGTAVWISDTRLYHPNVSFEEPTFHIQGLGKVICYTAGDFVNGGGEDLPKGAVIDMELAYIAALGFQNIRSLKYVSDNLSYKQYLNFNTPMDK